jgi:hypothetical protein
MGCHFSRLFATISRFQRLTIQPKLLAELAPILSQFSNLLSDKSSRWETCVAYKPVLQSNVSSPQEEELSDLANNEVLASLPLQQIPYGSLFSDFSSILGVLCYSFTNQVKN